MQCSQVQAAAARFVEEHGRTLERMLDEAGSAGSRGWAPGQAELEAAGLVLQLLARLVQHHARHPSTTAITLRMKAYQCAADLNLGLHSWKPTGFSSLLWLLMLISVLCRSTYQYTGEQAMYESLSLLLATHRHVFWQRAPNGAAACARHRLAVRFGSLDEQQQSPVLPALESARQGAGAMPPAERRKMERLSMQVGCASEGPV